MQINLHDLIFTGMKILGAYWIVSGIAYAGMNLIYSVEAIFMHWVHSVGQYNSLLDVTVEAFKIVNGIMYIVGGVILTRYTEKCMQFVCPAHDQSDQE